MAGTGAPYSDLPAGSPMPAGSDMVSELVRERGRPARLDRFSPDSGPLAAYLHRLGVHSAVGAPILVEGRLWGVLLAGSSTPLPANTEARLTDFAELAAVAVSNAETRAALAGSRARIVSAADETRRRIERDLHDGIQQRLVSLGLELRDAPVRDLGPPARRADEDRRGRRRADAHARRPARDLARHPPRDPRRRAGARAEGARPAQPACRSSSRSARSTRCRSRRRSPRTTSSPRRSRTRPSTATRPSCGCEARRDDGAIRVAVTDDGIGGADPARGSGLIGLSDRIGAIGGKLAIESPPGRGTSIVAELPS